jgi:hypothetical protein
MMVVLVQNMSVLQEAYMQVFSGPCRRALVEDCTWPASWELYIPSLEVDYTLGVWALDYK